MTKLMTKKKNMFDSTRERGNDGCYCVRQTLRSVLAGILMVLLLGLAVRAHAGPSREGMEFSGDYPRDRILKNIRTAIARATPLGIRDEKLSFNDAPFYFLKKTPTEFYVLTGDDLVFVGQADKPEKIYVSPLFHGEPGTARVFRRFVRKNRTLYLFAYDYAFKQGVGPDYFALSMSPEETWCTDIPDFQQWDAENASLNPSLHPRGILRDVVCADFDRDGHEEILCRIDRPSAKVPGGVERFVSIAKLQKSKRGPYQEFQPWKPTFEEVFRKKSE